MLLCDYNIHWPARAFCNCCHRNRLWLARHACWHGTQTSASWAAFKGIIKGLLQKLQRYVGHFTLHAAVKQLSCSV